jgi:hypothetical protein
MHEVLADSVPGSPRAGRGGHRVGTAPLVTEPLAHGAHGLSHGRSRIRRGAAPFELPDQVIRQLGQRGGREQLGEPVLHVRVAQGRPACARAPLIRVSLDG